MLKLNVKRSDRPVPASRSRPAVGSLSSSQSLLVNKLFGACEKDFSDPSASLLLIVAIARVLVELIDPECCCDVALNANRPDGPTGLRKVSGCLEIAETDRRPSRPITTTNIGIRRGEDVAAGRTCFRSRARHPRRRGAQLVFGILTVFYDMFTRSNLDVDIHTHAEIDENCRRLLYEKVLSVPDRIMQIASLYYLSSIPTNLSRVSH